MILRRATLADAQLLLDWHNDPLVRSMSSKQEVTTLDAHCDWLAQRIDDKREFSSCTGVFILEAKETPDSMPIPLGTGRIETDYEQIKHRACTLSYSIGKEYRGGGYGKTLIRLLIAQAKVFGFATYRARIKRSNEASIACAILCGVNSIDLFE